MSIDKKLLTGAIITSMAVMAIIIIVYSLIGNSITCYQTKEKIVNDRFGMLYHKEIPVVCPEININQTITIRWNE